MTMFPDPEELVVAYLRPLVAPVKVATRVPTQRPDSLVCVVRTGGSLRSVAHEDAQVTVECWADDSVAASLLAREVAAALEVMDVPGGHVPQGPPGWVGRPAYLEDPIAEVPRYVMTVLVRLRRLP